MRPARSPSHSQRSMSSRRQPRRATSHRVARLPSRKSSEARPPRRATFCDSPSASTEESPEKDQCQNGPNGTTMATDATVATALASTSSGRSSRWPPHDHAAYPAGSRPIAHVCRVSVATPTRTPAKRALFREPVRAATIAPQPGRSAKWAKFAACASVGLSAVAPASSSPAAHHPRASPGDAPGAVREHQRRGGQAERGDAVEWAQVTRPGGEERARVHERWDRRLPIDDVAVQRAAAPEHHAHRRDRALVRVEQLVHEPGQVDDERADHDRGGAERGPRCERMASTAGRLVSRHRPARGFGSWDSSLDAVGSPSSGGSSPWSASASLCSAWCGWSRSTTAPPRRRPGGTWGSSGWR